MEERSAHLPWNPDLAIPNHVIETVPLTNGHVGPLVQWLVEVDCKRDANMWLDQFVETGNAPSQKTRGGTDNVSATPNGARETRCARQGRTL